VAVPADSSPITRHELRTYLVDQGMTDWHIPTQLTYVPSLSPHNNGKVSKELLRRWLRGEAELVDE
jgi:non-ribosomal peptide synthetase component E (peptide arylation enzyme)